MSGATKVLHAIHVRVKSSTCDPESCEVNTERNEQQHKIKNNMAGSRTASPSSAAKAASARAPSPQASR